MTQNQSTIEEITGEFKALRDQGAPRENFDKLVRLGADLLERAQDASFEQIQNALKELVRPGEALRKTERNLLGLALAKTPSLEALEDLSQVDANARYNFRGYFLRAAVLLSKDKEDLITWLSKLGYINGDPSAWFVGL